MELKGKKLLERIHTRYKTMYEADRENRDLGLADMRFVNVPGEQWDANMKKERGERPCMEYNKLRVNGKRVINEIRANRPQGKVRAVEGGDKEVAEIYEGLCRNIANVSDFDTIVDNAAEYQVDAGMTCWRIDTQYSTDTSFDQDIVIRSIKNPFCLYADPACQDPLKRDAEDWLLTEKISNAAFEERYGKRTDKDSFEELGGFDDEDDWGDDESVRVVEYWWKEPHEKEIWLVDFGTGQPVTVDSESDEAAALDSVPHTIIRKRVCKTHKIMRCIASGSKVLDGPTRWAGTMFPFVMVYGEHKVIEGKFCWWGLHRFAKDAQKSYNIARTAQDETVALSPQAKFWATPEQAKGHTTLWSEAHKKNFPWMLYNVDPKVAGPPVDKPAPQVPVALIQQAITAAQDIRDVTGLHEASFGEESQEKSGVALARKQAQGQVVTYNFPDNMSKGVRRTWEIIIDLIPNIYDAEREVRILGNDGAEDYKKVNEIVMDYESGKAIRVNDLSTGKYDVTITTGPSYATARMEAAEVYTNMAGQSPEFMQIAGDLVFRSLDFPYAEDIAERWQTILPPAIQQKLSEGKEIPPEAQAVMAQAQQAMQAVQQHGQLVQAAQQELEGEKADIATDKAGLEKAKAELKSAIADLRREEAEFKAVVAEQRASLTEQKAALMVQKAELEARSAEVGDVETAARNIDSLQQTISAMDEMMGQFIQAAAGKMDQLNQEVSKPRPSMKMGRMRRDGGQLIAEMEFDDGSIKKLAAQRKNGQLEAVPIQ